MCSCTRDDAHVHVYIPNHFAAANRPGAVERQAVGWQRVHNGATTQRTASSHTYRGGRPRGRQERYQTTAEHQVTG